MAFSQQTCLEKGPVEAGTLSRSSPCHPRDLKEFKAAHRFQILLHPPSARSDLALGAYRGPS